MLRKPFFYLFVFSILITLLTGCDYAIVKKTATPTPVVVNPKVELPAGLPADWRPSQAAIVACTGAKPNSVWVVRDSTDKKLADVPCDVVLALATAPDSTETATPEASCSTSATPAVSSTTTGCTGYQLVQTVNFGQGSDKAIIQNMDVGDSQLWSVIQAWDTANTTSTFMAIVEPMQNLDFEAPRISGTYWFFTGSKEAVICRANQMWLEHGGSSYRLYIGSNAPTNWSTNFPSSWTMKTWSYKEPALEVEGSSWATITVVKTDATHQFGHNVGYTYGQLWNGTNAKIVYHIIVAQNYRTTTPTYQGTVWNVSGVNSAEGLKLLIQRFLQMTQEVIDRDDNPIVNRFYCGPASEKPTDWVTTMSGFTCTAP